MPNTGEPKYSFWFILAEGVRLILLYTASVQITIGQSCELNAGEFGISAVRTEVCSANRTASAKVVCHYGNDPL